MERMGKLRRSLRDSFRKRTNSLDTSKPQQWQADEEAVKGGNSSFHVKYLGSVEVFESRGMPVCEEAMKILRQSRRRPVKSVLHVSGDGLRLVEDETKGLILDQTIEKVSFCAPDRNHERGFSYICRDGTTRRWMCHGFLSTKDSGERLSHAVGCAFAACLERKQKREKDSDLKTSTFPRMNPNLRSNSMSDALVSKSANSSPPSGDFGRASSSANTTSGTSSSNPHAIERPHAPAKMLERQGSFRGFTQLANRSPFKRQLSLRLSELPSNLQRTQGNSNYIADPESISPTESSNTSSVVENGSPAPPPRVSIRNRLNSLPNSNLILQQTQTPSFPEKSKGRLVNTDSGPNLLRLDSKDLVTELCQQVTQGLSLLAANHDEQESVTESGKSSSAVMKKKGNPWDNQTLPQTSNHKDVVPPHLKKESNLSDDWVRNIPGEFTNKVWTQPINSTTNTSNSSSPLKTTPTKSLTATKIKENIVVSNQAVNSSNSGTGPVTRRVPPLQSALSFSSNSSTSTTRTQLTSIGRSQSVGGDPFDADWANSAARTGQTPTNPFAPTPPARQTFQISM